jgi:hypothetical protein
VKYSPGTKENPVLEINETQYNGVLCGICVTSIIIKTMKTILSLHVATLTETFEKKYHSEDQQLSAGTDAV